MFENFLSYLNNQGEEFIIDLKKFHEDNSEQIKHFVPGLDKCVTIYALVIHTSCLSYKLLLQMFFNYFTSE